jgi:hypothetical protein
MDFWQQQQFNLHHHQQLFQHHHQPHHLQQPQQPQPQPRRKAIPRPWLIKKPGQAPQYYIPSTMTRETAYHHDGMIHKAPIYGTSTSSSSQQQQRIDVSSLDVWDRPGWGLDLTKLTSCWECMRPATTTNNSSISKKTLSSLSKEQQQQYGPFAAFPALRRNSSESMRSYEMATSSNPHHPQQHPQRHAQHPILPHHANQHYSNHHHHHHRRRRSARIDDDDDDDEEEDVSFANKFVFSLGHPFVGWTL